jgi:hypothetical protein
VRLKATCLALSTIIVTALACNISSPRGPAEPTSEVVVVVETATQAEVANMPTESSESVSTPEGQKAESPASTNSGAGAETTTSPDGTIFSSVSVKDGSASYEGHITFPNIKTSTDIYVKPVGFDEVKTSGSLVFSLTCSGQGKAKVNYKGGKIVSGSPGCGESWTIYVINGSPDSQITLHLDAKGDIDWSMTVTSSN